MKHYEIIQCDDCGSNYRHYKGKPFYMVCKKCRNKTASKKDMIELSRQHQEDNWLKKCYQEKLRKSLNIKPNKVETKLLNLLQTNWPDKKWVYTGDFTFWIGSKNPDFRSLIDGNSLIELYGNYWHKGEDPMERVAFYNMYGYRCLVVWENEVKAKNNTDKLLAKLKAFIEK